MSARVFAAVGELVTSSSSAIWRRRSKSLASENRCSIEVIQNENHCARHTRRNAVRVYDSSNPVSFDW